MTMKLKGLCIYIYNEFRTLTRTSPPPHLLTKQADGNWRAKKPHNPRKEAGKKQESRCIWTCFLYCWKN
ncbi:hypothetical protein MLD38_020233 [Melastoma candidum]|uniref:Uncharacterized protein n=1 Tax=Melastoma candidum TaxID=119954 RepID=A0ACB9QCL0_9MYRT|nr:hypothetical protein MLD38_020233 [Melastoma candidum]